jgi:hypothetical protein
MENLLGNRIFISVAGRVVCVCVCVLPSRPSRKISMKINTLEELMVKVKLTLEQATKAQGEE